MPQFIVTAIKVGTDEQRKFLYDTDNSSLTDENFRSVIERPHFPPNDLFTPKMPKGKGGDELKTLKIQLGLSCNYECEYCSQRFVPHSSESNPDSVDSFVSGMDKWVTTPPERIEFWGGEPFVYIKTLKPLAESLRAKYPDAQFSVITNGSLLSFELNRWLDELGFAVSVSHDGPGQSVRGPDPLEDAEKREAIIDLYKRLAPKGRMSFNSMMTRSNNSRADIQSFFERLVGDASHLVIGEGSFVDAYDAGGEQHSLQNSDEDFSYRYSAFADIRGGFARRFVNVGRKMNLFAESLLQARPLKAVSQKCGMDKKGNLAVDMSGNVLTCQNVSSVSVNPSGESHKIGHVSNLADVEIKSSTHWSDRDECPTCPMIHICQGSCMFLSGPLWESSCDNSFADAVPIFAGAIEALTGFVPVHIEGPQREDRKDIFGLFQNEAKAAKKQFPIPVVSA